MEGNWSYGGGPSGHHRRELEKYRTARLQKAFQQEESKARLTAALKVLGVIAFVLAVLVVAVLISGSWASTTSTQPNRKTESIKGR